MTIPLAILIVLTSISVLLFFTLVFFWSTYNTFIKSRNQVKTDYSDIDIQLKRKVSLVEQLVILIKEYAKHEKETFENVAKARSALDTSKNATDAAKAENMLSQTLRSLFAVVENYPKLQANENYQTTIAELKQTENNIAKYREEYNQTVQRYNNLVQTFPNLVSAAIFNFKSAKLFQDNKISDK
jgi:LemA protein